MSTNGKEVSFAPLDVTNEVSNFSSSLVRVVRVLLVPTHRPGLVSLFFCVENYRSENALQKLQAEVCVYVFDGLVQLR